MQPPLPLIAVINHGLMLITDTSFWNRRSALSLLRNVENSAQYFDATGLRWKTKIYCAEFKPTWWNRLLANTFYNPSFLVTHEWIQTGTYALEELKQQIISCIDDDDDILTQWVDASILKVKLQQCRHYDDVCQMLSKYIFDPNEEEIYKEFPSEE